MVGGVGLGLLVPGGETNHRYVPGGGAHHPSHPAPPIPHHHHNGRWSLLIIAAVLQEGLCPAQIRVAAREGGVGVGVRGG